MRKLATIAACVGIGLVISGCDPQAPQQQKDQSTLSSAMRQSGEGPMPEPQWEALRPMGYPQKEEALDEYGEAMAALDLKIKILENRVAESDPDVGHDIKEGWKEDTENLRQRRDMLAEDFAKLERATPENWERSQSSFIEDWNELRNRWEGVRAE